jgi:hypothetical protein
VASGIKTGITGDACGEHLDLKGGRKVSSAGLVSLGDMENLNVAQATINNLSLQVHVLALFSTAQNWGRRALMTGRAAALHSLSLANLAFEFNFQEVAASELGAGPSE